MAIFEVLGVMAYYRCDIVIAYLRIEELIASVQVMAHHVDWTRAKLVATAYHRRSKVQQLP